RLPDYSSDAGFLGKQLVSVYTAFQSVASDPQVVIPSNVNAAEVYFQNSSAAKFSPFSGEAYLNLWGEGPSLLINRSRAYLRRVDWTNKRDVALGVIGHSEVPLLYERTIIKTGQAYL